MDTTAYLSSQGWLGTGHALATRGLSKPLLVSQKQNVLGVGKKRHDAHADQWWARAFDGCLKGLEVSKVADGKVGGKGEGGILGEGKKDGHGGETGVRIEGRGGGLGALRSGSWGRGGLYGFFVRGEGLRGTFVEEAVVAGKVGGVETTSTDRLVDEQRAERKLKRKERKERNIAEAMVVVEEVPDGELSKRLRKEERKRRRDRDGAEDDAEDSAVAATAIAGSTRGVSSPSLRKKKRRRGEASDGGGSPELVTPDDHVTMATSASGSYEGKATGEANYETMQGKEQSLVEKEERRRRKAARKALKAEQNRSGDGQAGQEADGTNKTHRKKKRKHTER